MRLHLVTGPVSEPITLAEAKLHRRVDGTAEDPLLFELITAARQLFEEETGRQLITATWRADLDAFPIYSREPIWLPKAPLLSVTGITYIDTAGASQTWSASEYTVRTQAGPFARPGSVYPAPDYTYPSTRRVPNAVSVTFTAGYGANASDVPAGVKTAVLELLGDMYEERESFMTGTIVTPNPASARLLNRFRVPVYA